MEWDRYIFEWKLWSFTDWSFKIACYHCKSRRL